MEAAVEEAMRPLKKSNKLPAIKIRENFQKNTNYRSRKFETDRLFCPMTSPFYLHNQPDLSRISGFSVRWAHATLG
ncbi:MAG: hypothetical protein ABFD57_09570, partial [Smithella sp.]